MNRTKIEWTNYSWNPIVGCSHGCWYCYGKRNASWNYYRHLGSYKKGKRKNPPCKLCRDFIPHFHPERLKELEKMKKPAKIFVCSVADLFAPWTKPEWRNAVLNEIQKSEYNHLTFQLLTKNPENITLEPKENIWIGTTITCQEEMVKAYTLIGHYDGIKFVSFEPLLGRIELPVLDINWIIVGKLTGSKKIQLDPYWVKYLIARARFFKIPIFLKNNLKWSEKIQEFPKLKELK